MQEKNAMDLIQAVKDYFKTEYGLEVNITVGCHPSYNKRSGLELLNVAQEIHKQVGGELKSKSREGAYWHEVDSFKKRTNIVFFYEGEVQA